MISFLFYFILYQSIISAFDWPLLSLYIENWRNQLFYLHIILLYIYCVPHVQFNRLGIKKSVYHKIIGDKNKSNRSLSCSLRSPPKFAPWKTQFKFRIFLKRERSNDRFVIRHLVLVVSLTVLFVKILVRQCDTARSKQMEFILHHVTKDTHLAQVFSRRVPGLNFTYSLLTKQLEKSIRVTKKDFI